MSTTPKTDALLRMEHDCPSERVCEFMREQEEELAEAKSDAVASEMMLKQVCDERDRWKEKFAEHYNGDDLALLIKERDTAIKERDEALRARDAATLEMAQTCNQFAAERDTARQQLEETQRKLSETANSVLISDEEHEYLLGIAASEQRLREALSIFNKGDGTATNPFKCQFHISSEELAQVQSALSTPPTALTEQQRGICAICDLPFTDIAGHMTLHRATPALAEHDAKKPRKEGDELRTQLAEARSLVEVLTANMNFETNRANQAEAERTTAIKEREIADDLNSEISTARDEAEKQRDQLQRYIDTDESAKEFAELKRHRDHLVQQNADLLGDGGNPPRIAVSDALLNKLKEPLADDIQPGEDVDEYLCHEELLAVEMVKQLAAEIIQLRAEIKKSKEEKP